MNRAGVSMETGRLPEVVLVVNDHAGIAESLRGRYPTWEVAEAESYLSAIGELSRRRVRAVVAYVEASQDEIEQAVAGIREAAGEATRVVLCCRAEAEPLTLRALKAGADEYVLHPLRGRELDEALLNSKARAEGDGSAAAGGAGSAAAGVAVESLAELQALGEVVSRLGAPPEEMLGSVAEYLRTALGAAGARVVVEGTVGQAGEASGDPEMVEPLFCGNKSIGHAAVGGKAEGDYAPEDVVKLHQYGRLIGHLVSAWLDRRRLETLAYTDELSGLPNRRYMLEFLEDALAKARAGNSTVTLLMFDIDDFKRYNDAYGHDAGDEILKGCGELFRGNIREHDVVTRYGGDEFAVIFWDKGGTRTEGSQHPREVLPLIERFRRSLRGHRFARFRLPENARLTISGGLASFPQDGTTVEALISRADERLLAAKREGKNRIYLGGENGGEALGDEG